MSSKKGGGKPPPVPLINLAEIRKRPKKKARQLSTTSNAEPVVDGITTTSGLELPFNLEDPSHDPVLQQPKLAADTTTAAAQEKKPPANNSKEQERSTSDMDMSDDSSTSSTSTDTSRDSSDDSSVDIPLARLRRPTVQKKKAVPQKSKKQSGNVVAMQAEKTVARVQPATKAAAKAPTQATVEKKQATKQKKPATKDSAAKPAAKQKQVHSAAKGTEETTPKAVTTQSIAEVKQTAKRKKAATEDSAEKWMPVQSQASWQPSFGKESLRHNQSSEASGAAEQLQSRSLEAPSRKRARTEALENNNENAPPAPMLGEHPRPRLNEEEQRLFDKIDRMILDDEWAELKQKIDGQILEAEEKDLLDRVDQSIRAAEEARKPGGRVLYSARRLEDGSLQEEYLSVTEDPLLVDEDSTRGSTVNEAPDMLPRSRTSRVMDVEDFSVEVSHKARLPKYSGDGKARIITREALRKNVVDPIMAKGRGYVLPGKLCCRLVDIPNDPYSVLLHCQGHPHLVEQVEKQVTSLVRAEQRRWEDERAVREAGEQVRARKQAQAEKQQRNFSAYKAFSDTYKGVIDVEYKGTGVHGQRVKKCMWDCHKQKYGASCPDDCECPSDLPYLTHTVVDSFIANEMKKNPNWENHLAPTIGFAEFFSEKFYALLEKEFPNELPKQLLERLLLMWAKHQKEARFGMRCSSSCPCREGWEVVFKRGHLRDHEITDAKKRGRKTSTPKLASTRIPRKQKANPSDSNTGGTTFLSRPAVAASTSMTGDEATTSVAHASRIPRRSSAPPRDAASTSPIPLASTLGKSAAILRRGSATTMDTTTGASGTAPAAIPRRGAVIDRKATLSQSLPYEIVFQPGEAMGFYCINEKRTGSPDVCKIVSVRESTKRMHPKLQVGAIVTDVSHGSGGHVQPVRTYSDLNNHYKKAKGNGNPITVRFLNPKSSLIGNLMVPPDSQSSHGSWTASGDWIMGPSSQGWAGGARCINSKESQAQKSAPKSSREIGEAEMGSRPVQARGIPSSETTILSRAHAQAPPPKPSPPSIEYATTMNPAKHRELKPSTSILRPATDWNQKKNPTLSDKNAGTSVFKAIAGKSRNRKIKISEDRNENRFFDLQLPSFRISVPNLPQSGAPSDSPAPEVVAPKVTTTKDLIDAIENKDYREVIAVLQQGASPSAPDEANKSPKEHVKSRLQDLQFALEEDPSNSKLIAQRKDFDLKRKVLSIFIDSQSTIDKARYNRKWQRYNVNLDRIKEVCLSVRGNDYPGSKVLQCRTRVKGEDMKPMPPIPIEGTIMHDCRNDPSSQGYSFNYNPHLGDPLRSDITFSLYKGETSDTIPPLLLGQAVIPLSRISTATIEHEKIQERLSPNDFLTNCVISVTPKKLDADEIREGKRKEAASKLRDVVTWISQFNKETKRGENDDGALSGQITEPKCGISLLHAAIYLDEPDLVSKLLCLGADPEAPSDVGSPRLLAINMFAERDAHKKDKKSREVLSLLLGNGRREECDTVDEEDASSPQAAASASPPQATDRMSSEAAAADNASPPRASEHALDEDINPMSSRSEGPHAVSTASTAHESRTVPLPSYVAQVNEGGTKGASTSAEDTLISSVCTTLPHAADERRGNRSKEGENKASSNSTGGTLVSSSRANLGIMSPYAALADESGVDRSPPKADLPPASLPILDYWERPNERGRCRFFGKNGRWDGCNRGAKCPFMHFAPSVGREFDETDPGAADDSSLLDSGRTVIKNMRNKDGRLLFTAIHQDQRDKIWSAAEGQALGSRYGVSWYNTEQEAIRALKRVLAFHERNERNRRFIPGPPPSRTQGPHDVPHHGIYGPSSGSKRPRDERRESRPAVEHDKRARHERTRDVSPSAGSNQKSLFSRVIKQPNLSLIYTQIFGEQIRRDDWIVKKDGQGLYSATLVLPSDSSKRYHSSQKGGGFATERLAKASAFVSLLEACIKYGRVNVDCTMAEDGRRLSL